MTINPYLSAMPAWAKHAGGSMHDNAKRVFPLPDNSVLMTGQYDDRAVFGPGDKNETILKNAELGDVFVAKYNADGSLAWAKSGRGESIDMGSGVSAWDDGSIVVAGYYDYGATDPAEAAEGTVRKDLASSKQENVVHGSDSPENAAIELSFFFSREELLSTNPV